jgi:uncharacterized protein YwgA
MSLERIVTDVVALNGGQLAGRTRLQKTIYLLDQLGMNSGAAFIYHHYGPFSSDVVSAWEFSEVMHDFRTTKRPGNYGSYTLFESNETAHDQIGGLDQDEVRSVLSKLRGVSDIVLELAATIVFLKRNGYERSAEQEVAIRKPLKATPERLTRAQTLIAELRL